MGRRRERRQEKNSEEKLRDCRTCSMCGTSKSQDGEQSYAEQYMGRFISRSQRWGWRTSDYPDLTYGSCDECQGQYCPDCTVYTDCDLMGTSGSWCVCSLCYKTHATYQGKATYMIDGADAEWQLV